MYMWKCTQQTNINREIYFHLLQICCADGLIIILCLYFVSCNILSRVTVPSTLVCIGGFIGYFLVITTNNYNTTVDFHTTKHSTLIASVYRHKSSRIYITQEL
jgi:hypothetical protein